MCYINYKTEIMQVKNEGNFEQSLMDTKYFQSKFQN